MRVALTYRVLQHWRVPVFRRLSTSPGIVFRAFHGADIPGTDAVNGVVIAGAFDLTIGLVGHLHTLGQRSGTVQLSMHFLRPVLGDRFEVLGRVVRAGSSLVFAAAELHDENGKLCARCDGIVAVAREPEAEIDETIAL